MPGPALTYRCELCASPETVCEVRELIPRILSVAGVPADLVDTVRLCAHELVANVVKHVGDGAPFRLVLGADADGVSVEVHDRDDARHPVVREVDWQAVSGRGMHIVRECAPGWSSTVSDFGKSVAFRVAY